MALLGGGVGGAGNPVGGSYTGLSTSLEIVGDFAYSYNQTPGVNPAASVTLHEFTTGNFLFVGSLDLVGPIDYDDPNDGGVAACQISLNGSTIALVKSAANPEQMDQPSTYQLIIPAYTAVKIEVFMSTTSGSYTTSSALTGRIYRDV